ncbi:MAG TPA: glutaredoxin [Gammaproteobacteria bacterium]|nr:glutaredoxin [Gammaproteobacteria bacterium]
MKIIRWVLGRIILAIEFVMTPKGVQRDKQLQQKLDDETSAYRLYQFAACPFCVKVRFAIKKQNMKIELVDAKNDKHHQAELVTMGGQLKVPCLRISKADGEDIWMYESDDIIRFLNQKADAISAVTAAA